MVCVALEALGALLNSYRGYVESFALSSIGTIPGRREESRDKCLGGILKFLMLKILLRFLVFYTPQGGTTKSDRLSRVRH